MIGQAIAYSRGVRALSIDVPEELAQLWARWFAPERQPFLVDETMAEKLSVERSAAPLPDELRDSFAVYSLPEHLGVVWFDEPTFMALPRRVRTALVRSQTTYERELVPSVKAWRGRIGERVKDQADGQRFVWWPSLLHGHEDDVLTAYVEEGRRPSRHHEVTEETWNRVVGLLPGARALGGAFALASGPNCFGTVMAAAGMADAAKVWMLREPFEEWLSDAARPGGRDEDPGTVLVWRSADGLVQHAGVTIGDGWALHKPSQGWMSPRKVLRVEEVKASARARGRRLHRYRLRSWPGATAAQR